MTDTFISIIEDDESIRESLQLFIEAKTLYTIVSTHNSVEDFLEKIDGLGQLDIILLDIGLPGMSGLQGLPHIKSKLHEVDIIMLTTYQETEIIFQALCSGACSYISKKTPLPKIIDALHIVKNGGSYMSPSIARKITERMASGFSSKKKVKLTDQQNTIIKYIVDGLKYSEIAKECSISVNTVRFHIKKIYSILQINSKVELYKKYVDGEI